jgi:hypothetical protein
MPIRLYHWSNPSIKDMLMMMMQGKSSAWEIPNQIGNDYIQEVTAEYRARGCRHPGSDSLQVGQKTPR